MPKRRIPKKDINLEQQIEVFGNLAEISTTKPVDFEQLSLDDLAQRYREIDQQSHLFKGCIILAARSKFNSDKQFGTWLSDNLSDLNQKQAHRLMSLAAFFGEKSNRSMKGIGISACYELTAPKNSPIAKEVYFEIAGKSYPLAVVREKLSNKLNDYLAKQQKSIASEQPLDLLESTLEEPAVEMNEYITETVAVEAESFPSFNRPEQINNLINITLAGLKSKEKLDFLAECIVVIKKGGINNKSLVL